VEPCDHGLEYEADVRPQPRLTEPCAAWRKFKTPRRKVDRGPSRRVLGPIKRQMNVRAAKTGLAIKL